MKKNFYICAILCSFLILINGCKKDDFIPELVTDIDGNEYHTVAIGTQIWMVENLKVKHYQDGTPIPEVSDKLEWSNLKSDAFCYYNNSDSLFNIYGGLYNYYSMIDPRNICPDGWRIPSEEDWDILFAYTGESTAANKLKETGTEHWIEQNYAVNNVTGFTALPGGLRIDKGIYILLGTWAYFGTSTSENDSLCRVTILLNDQADIPVAGDLKQVGYSVRCVKD